MAVFNAGVSGVFLLEELLQPNERGYIEIVAMKTQK
jgi:hypothetical protein